MAQEGWTSTDNELYVTNGKREARLGIKIMAAAISIVHAACEQPHRISASPAILAGVMATAEASISEARLGKAGAPLQLPRSFNNHLFSERQNEPISIA